MNCECNMATGERKQRERPSKIDVIIFLFFVRIHMHTNNVSFAYYQIGNGVRHESAVRWHTVRAKLNRMNGEVEEGTAIRV